MITCNNNKCFSTDGDKRYRHKYYERCSFHCTSTGQDCGGSTSACPVQSIQCSDHCYCCLFDARWCKCTIILPSPDLNVPITQLCLQVIIVIRRKRRLDRLRHSLIPFYSFDVNEEEDWDSDLLQHENGTQTIRVSDLSY